MVIRSDKLTAFDAMDQRWLRCDIVFDFGRVGDQWTQVTRNFVYGQIAKRIRRANSRGLKSGFGAIVDVALHGALMRRIDCDRFGGVFWWGTFGWRHHVGQRVLAMTTVFDFRF